MAAAKYRLAQIDTGTAGDKDGESVQVAAAVARDAQPEWLELLLNTQSHCGVRRGRARLDLPPFAVVARSPLRLCHRRPLS